MFKAFRLLWFLCLAGCQLIPMPTSTPTAPGAPTPTLTATIVPTPGETITPQPTPTAEVERVCSPLKLAQISELPAMVVNAYNPPAAGSDDPHQGMDLAFTAGEEKVAVGGQEVDTVLAGKVAGIIADRFPYGNAVMIESAIDQLPASITIPGVLEKLNPPGSLTCPDYSSHTDLLSNPRSVYLLYAHLGSISDLQVDQEVQCGAPLGIVGNSGNALNPHLHLEVRVGPAGMKFTSMGHYDPSVNGLEIANYCAWRVSGLFQTIDPGCLFGFCQ